ncbi:MAG TPA: hypothetical protein VFE14_02195 [Micromonosporaceae bacterium]|jgi:hypothetical protein|nr:hypothetical protein [Micromonosporaceae bacterium]
MPVVVDNYATTHDWGDEFTDQAEKNANVLHCSAPFSGALQAKGEESMQMHPVRAPEDTLGAVTRNLVAVKPSLEPSMVRLNSSLTADLGLGSLDLVELASGLADDYGPMDLAPWLSQAMRPGGDTVGSLVAFLAGLPSAAGANS